MQQSDLDRRLAVLFRDYGYRWTGDTLVQKGTRMYRGETVVGRFRSALAAAEYLCPRVSDPEYIAHLNRICER